MQIRSIGTQPNYYANSMSMGNNAKKEVVKIMEKDVVDVHKMKRESLLNLRRALDLARERGDNETVRILTKADQKISLQHIDENLSRSWWRYDNGLF